MADKTTSGGWLGYTAVSLAILIPVSALRARVLQDVWLWFSGLPPLGWWQAWGVVLLVFLITPTGGEKAPDYSTGEQYGRLGRALVGDVFILLFVWALASAIAHVSGRA